LKTIWNGHRPISDPARKQIVIAADHRYAARVFHLNFQRSGFCLSLSRSDAVGNGERDRPGRSVRRLAEQKGRQIPSAEWCGKAIAAGASAGRRR